MIQFLGTNLHCKCFHFNDDDFYIFICRVLFYTFQQTVMFLLCSLFEIVRKSWHMHIPKKLLNRCWSCNTLIHMRKHCTLFLMLPPGHVSYLMKTKALKLRNFLRALEAVCDVFPVGVWTQMAVKTCSVISLVKCGTAQTGCSVRPMWGDRHKRSVSTGKRALRGEI